MLPPLMLIKLVIEEKAELGASDSVTKSLRSLLLSDPFNLNVTGELLALNTPKDFAVANVSSEFWVDFLRKFKLECCRKGLPDVN